VSISGAINEWRRLVKRQDEQFMETDSMPMFRVDQATRRQVSRFAVVGGASVAVDLAVYWLLSSAAILPADAAKACSYAAGVVLGFCGNKWWTFGSRRRSASEPVVYIMLYAATLAVNVGCNRAVLALIGESGKLGAFLVATGLTTVLNFLGMKLVTFRRGAAERAADRIPATKMRRAA
jgi:putative flippase GtrA